VDLVGDEMALGHFRCIKLWLLCCRYPPLGTSSSLETECDMFSPLNAVRSKWAIWLIVYISLASLYYSYRSYREFMLNVQPTTLEAQVEEAQVDVLKTIKEYWIDYPLPADAFGELGRRIQLLTEWVAEADQLSSRRSSEKQRNITEESYSELEGVLVSQFPFLLNPVRRDDATPFRSLRKTFVPRSRGIVIAAGKSQFRFTAHLISSLRNVLKSELPIEIAYAGSEDLPEEYRDALRSLDSDISFLDILTIFDDETLDLSKGGWAIKPFALLASTFEQVILIDADAVFLQDPTVLLDNHSKYLETGALFFHDRLLWKDVFKDRQKWWQKEMSHRTPSRALMNSRVWTEGYAEEGDSGVVVIDKRRLEAVMGLLHACWQNTKEVREKWTYKMMYGDKESYWLGFELSGVPYAFEDHYGSIAGHIVTDPREKLDKVCSFTIAHLDEQNRLLWYNGSLLKNKAMNATDFEVPEHWMTDAEWEKGATKPDISCMKRGEVRSIDSDLVEVVRKSIDAAKAVDVRFAGIGRPK
jgi:alpha 1,3-mannosyltransferase